MIKAELKAKREVVHERIKKENEERWREMHRAQERQMQGERRQQRPSQQMTLKVQKSLERETKKREEANESQLQIFKDVARVKNPSKAHAQIYANWAKWKRKEIQSNSKHFKSKFLGLFDVLKVKHRTQKQNCSRQSGLAQSQSAAMSQIMMFTSLPKRRPLVNVAAGKNRQSSKKSTREALSIKIRKVNDNDRAVRKAEREELLAHRYDADLAQKWRKLTPILKDALQREERESVRFQTTLSTIKQQYEFHLRTQVSQEHLKTTDGRLRELCKDRDEAGAQLSKKSSLSNTKEMDATDPLNREATVVEPLITDQSNTMHGVFYNYQNESLEQLVKPKNELNKSEPNCNHTVTYEKGSIESSTKDIEYERIGKSAQTKVRPLSSKVRVNRYQRYEQANDGSAMRDLVNQYEESKVKILQDNSRRSLFQPGHQYIFDDQQNRVYSRTGVTTAKGFVDNRENAQASRAEHNFLKEPDGKQIKLGQVFSKCNTKPKIGTNPSTVQKLKKATGSRLDVGCITDLTTSGSRSERKRQSGTATGTQLSNKMARYESASEIGGFFKVQPQQQDAKQSLATHTIANLENLRLNTLIDTKHNNIETLQDTSQSLTRTQKVQNNSWVREKDIQQFSNQRPTTAQPLIKSKAYTIKNMSSKNRLVTEEALHPLSREGLNQDSPAEVYKRLEARTKQVFDQGQVGTIQNDDLRELDHAEAKDLEGGLSKKVSITAKTQAPFTNSGRYSLFTAKDKDVIPEQVVDSESGHLPVSTQERKDLIKELQNQLRDLQSINKIYKKQLQKQRHSQQPKRIQDLSIDAQIQQLVNPAENLQTNFDMQELFFECAHKAIRMKNLQQKKLVSFRKGRQGNLQRVIASQRLVKEPRTVADKMNLLLDFVTNKHVLQILYDVMFRFQMVQEKALHDDQGCLSNEFMQEVFNLSDGTLTALQSRKPSLPVQSLGARGKGRAKRRLSRNDESANQTEKLAFTRGNSSNFDQSENINQLNTAPSLISRDEARRLALKKLTQKQKQNMRNQNSFFAYQPTSQQMQQIQSHFIMVNTRPAKGPSDQTLNIDSGSATHPEKLVKTASDVSQAQVILLQSDPGSADQVGTGNHPDENVGINAVDVDEKKAAVEDQKRNIDINIQKPIDSYSGDNQTAEGNDPEYDELRPKKNLQMVAKPVETALLSRKESNKSAADPAKPLQFGMQDGFKQLQPVEIQLQNEGQSAAQVASGSRPYRLEQKQRRQSTWNEGHEYNMTNGRGTGKSSHKAQASSDKWSKGRRPKTIDSNRRSSNLKDHIFYEQNIKQNIQESRQRQLEMLNAITPMLEVHGTTLENYQHIFVPGQRNEGSRPHSHKSSALLEDERVGEDILPQSATLDVEEQRARSKYTSKVSIEADAQLQSQQENNRMKRRSIQLNISNKNVRLQGYEQGLHSPSYSQDAQISKSNDDYQDLTEQLSPGQPLEPKPESMTVANTQPYPSHPAKNRESIKKTKARRASNNDDLNLDLNFEGQSSNGNGQKAQLQLENKDPMLFISKKRFTSSLDERRYRSLQGSAEFGKPDQGSSQPRLEDSREFTENLRNQAHDPSDLVDHHEQNQTSFMQQQVVPVSSVHIANAPSTQARAQTENSLQSEGQLTSKDAKFNSNGGPQQANLNQTLKTISVKNVEQAAAAPVPQNVNFINQFEPQVDEAKSQDLARPGAATIISASQLPDLAQFRVPAPPSRPISQYKVKTAATRPRQTQDRRAPARPPDMLQKLKKVDQKVREERASSKASRRRY